MAVSVSSSTALQARQKMLSAAAQLQVGPMAYFWLLAQWLSDLQGTELPAVPWAVLWSSILISSETRHWASPARKDRVTLKVKSRNNKGKKQQKEKTKEIGKEINRYEPVNNDHREAYEFADWEFKVTILIFAVQKPLIGLFIINLLMKHLNSSIPTSATDGTWVVLNRSIKSFCVSVHYLLCK